MRTPMFLFSFSPVAQLNAEQELHEPFPFLESKLPQKAPVQESQTVAIPSRDMIDVARVGVAMENSEIPTWSSL